MMIAQPFDRCARPFPRCLDKRSGVLHARPKAFFLSKEFARQQGPGLVRDALHMAGLLRLIFEPRQFPLKTKLITHAIDVLSRSAVPSVLLTLPIVPTKHRKPSRKYRSVEDCLDVLCVDLKQNSLPVRAILNTQQGDTKSTDEESRLLKEYIKSLDFIRQGGYKAMVHGCRVHGYTGPGYDAIRGEVENGQARKQFRTKPSSPRREQFLCGLDI